MDLVELTIVLWLLLCGGTTALLLAAFVLIKPALLRSYSADVRLVPVAMERFPNRDSARIDDLSQQFLDLGFGRLADFTWEADRIARGQALIRLLVHPQERCFAVIQQGFRGRRRGAVQTALITLLDRGSSLVASAQEPDPFLASLRRPHRLSLCVPGAEPAELLERHLTQRKAVLVEAGLSPLADLSPAAYEEYVKQNMRELNALVRSKSRWYLLGATKRLKKMPESERLEWLGGRTLSARRDT
jgi:hypothetical protein